MKKEINPEYLACPIRQVISRFDDKWSMLVLYALDRSDTGVMRFSELHAHMSDCSQNISSLTWGCRSFLPSNSSSAGPRSTSTRWSGHNCGHHVAVLFSSLF